MVRYNDSEFDDVRHDIDHHGVLQGDAIKTQSSSHSKFAGDGEHIYVHCATCGTQHDIGVEWSELLIMASQGAPPGWQYTQDHGGFVLTGQGCRICTQMLPIVLFPDTVRQNLDKAVRNNVIKAEQLRALHGELIQRGLIRPSR